MQFVKVLMLAALVGATQVKDPGAENVVERPALSGEPPEGSQAEAGARGVEAATSQEGRAPRLVFARQGVPVGGGINMFSKTISALNPVPYLLGGLNSVRQAMNQRFNPITRNLQRPKFREGPRFIFNSGGKHGGGGGKHVGEGNVWHAGGGGGRGFSNGGGASGDARPIHGREKPFHPDTRGAADASTFQGGAQTRKIPSSGSSFTNSAGKGDINTKANIDNTNYLPSLSQTFSGSSESSSSSPKSEKKFPRVINIQVPDEMPNLTVVEISMRADGEVTIGKDLSHESSNPPPPAPSSSPVKTDDASASLYPSLPPGVGDIFAEDQRLHGFNSETNLHEFDFYTNPEGFHGEDPDFLEFLPTRPTSFDSIQDLLRMQSLGNTGSNNAFEYRIPHNWNSMNNIKPTAFSNEYSPVQLSQSLMKSIPVPNFPPHFVPDEKNSNTYYVPISLFPSRPRRLSTGYSASPVTIQKQRGQAGGGVSPVYYIDITIPGDRGGAPIVNAMRFRRHKRSLQYDGWYPMDVSNPMADDPTVGYQPPPLERVHFSNEPMPKKPMYPVRPENPPVFVVRSEPRQPEYHSVYGTENVEYFHIHPQTNTVRAFRAPSQSVGAFRFVPAPQFDSQHSSPGSKVYMETLENTSKNLGAYAHLLGGFDYLDIPVKEPGFADKSDTFRGRPAQGSVRLPDQTSYYDVADDYDMEGAFSEIHATTVVRPAHHFFPFGRGDRNPGPGRRPSHRHRPDPPSRRSEIPPARDQESKSPRPALHELLGNFPEESQIEEAPFLGSATDSAGASFVREIPPPHFRYSTRRHNKAQPSDSDRSPQREGTLERPPGKRPWFLIDTRSSNRKREPSIASYIQPETHSGDEKIHFRPFGPVSFVSKAGGKTAAGHIHNPHLDDHMNSYKPTLTANSLSELLQIFRFTHVTDKPGDKDATDEPVTIIREFRYTRPTETPPTTFPPPTESAANRSSLSTSYRYTPSPPRFGDSTTEAGVTKKPGKRHFDAVADTNSLDGYLFSDSEANPEYAHPQVRPNVVVIKSKDEDVSKGVVKQSSRVSVSSSSIFRGSSVTPDTFEELEIIYPGPPPKGTTAASWPLYIIHQGHSKVKVFGINSAEDEGLGNSGFTDIYVFPPNEPTTTTAPTTTLTTAPTSTLSSTTSTTSSTSTSTTLTVTHSTAVPTTPFPVDDNSTIPATEAIPTTAPAPDYGPAPTEATDGHEYHDADEFGVPDLTFGEDYQPEGWERPSLRLPGPSVALSYLARPTPPPPTEAPDALAPTDLSMASTESSTQRLGSTTEEETQTSPPFEQLETDRSPDGKDSLLPQPRMERAAAEA